jgi:hypothetical protein
MMVHYLYCRADSFLPCSCVRLGDSINRESNLSAGQPALGTGEVPIPFLVFCLRVATLARYDLLSALEFVSIIARPITCTSV